MAGDDFTVMLARIGAGESASSELMAALYDELHAMADRLMRQERDTHTLQPTALVHEAFLRLVDAKQAGAEGRAQFLAAAAVTMRRVLVDYARASSAAKRGGVMRRRRVTLRAVADDAPEEEVEIAALDDALVELAGLGEQKAKIVELRFFGGMSAEQIAEYLGVSRRTVFRDLAFSRAWLRRRMRRRGA